MVAHSAHEQHAAPAPTDDQLLAFEEVREAASMLSSMASALIVASTTCDLAATKASRRQCRSLVQIAIMCWRDAVPEPSKRGGGDG